MSNRERAIQLIEDVPEQKLTFVIGILESLKAYAGEAIQPDDWDLQMIEEARRENDGQTVEIGELARELGVRL